MTSKNPARNSASELPADVVYRSGAAARLAGVPVETLRVWERRYAIVGPNVSARGQRLYTAEQVRRLSLIKQLVGLGNPVGSIAGLTDDALREMHATACAISPLAASGQRAAPRFIQAALVGETFVGAYSAALGRTSRLDVVTTCTRVEDLQAHEAGAVPRALVMEIPAIGDGTAATIDEARKKVAATAAIILYRFAQRDAVHRLRKLGHVVARMPFDPTEIEALCIAAIAAAPQAKQVPAKEQRASSQRLPRFDERSLAELAQSSNTVECECPRHLADLLRMLGSFERYSAACESRNPRDAELHRDLANTTGEARMLLEEALLRVARAEGLNVTGQATTA
jgi:DNA-binding transcriptional MerR regulator